MTFYPISLRERVAEFLFPGLRREREARLKRAIAWAVANPEAEVRVLDRRG